MTTKKVLNIRNRKHIPDVHFKASILCIHENGTAKHQPRNTHVNLSVKSSSVQPKELSDFGIKSPIMIKYATPTPNVIQNTTTSTTGVSFLFTPINALTAMCYCML